MEEEVTNASDDPSEELESLKLKLNEVLQSINSLQSEEGRLQAISLLQTVTSEAQTTVTSEVQTTVPSEVQAPAAPETKTAVTSEAQIVKSEAESTHVHCDVKEDQAGSSQEVTHDVPDSVTPLPHGEKTKRKVGRPRKTDAKNKDASSESSILPARGRSKRKALYPRRVNRHDIIEERKSKRIRIARIKTQECEQKEGGNTVIISHDTDDDDDDGDDSSLKEKWAIKRKISHTCCLCGNVFSHGKTFNAHIRAHGEAACCCRLCKEEFYNVADLTHHTCRALKPSKRVRTCHICGEQFTNAKLHDSHLIRLHNEHPEPKYKCKFCPRQFARKNNFRMHLRLHASQSSKVVCMVCGQFFENLEALTDHENEHRANAQATCDICGMFFMRSQQYDQHMQAHKKYDCKLCDRPFFRKKAALKHQKTVHSMEVPHEPKKYECPTCGKKMQRPGMLEIHMRIHTGEKPIECKLCHLFFRTPKAYTKHRLTTTHMKRSGEIPKEREYMCELCGSSYYRKQALQRHMNAGHFREKIYKCSYCEFACTELSNLRVHVNLHFDSARNYVCELCGSAFHSKKTLHEHTIYKHTDDRNFICDTCSMSFKTKNALVRHSKIHQTEKPYVCHCGTSFRRSYNLRRHSLKIHGTDSNLPPVRKVQVLDANPENEPVVTKTKKKRTSKPALANQIDALLSETVQQEISVVTLHDHSIVNPNITHKPVESYEVPQHTSFLEQLASAVEFSREELAAEQVVETEPHNMPAKTTMNWITPAVTSQDEKNVYYKWHQIAPDNIRLHQYNTEGSLALPGQSYFPVVSDAVHYTDSVVVRDTTNRVHYEQDINQVLQFQQQQQP